MSSTFYQDKILEKISKTALSIDEGPANNVMAFNKFKSAGLAFVELFPDFKMSTRRVMKSDTERI